MFKVLVPAVAALGLAAFAARSQGAASPPVMSQPVMSWTLHHEGSVAKLAYGVPNSDQLTLMVSCAPGDALATVYGDVRLETPRIVHASHGPQPIDPLSGGSAEEVQIALTDIGLDHLADGGRMTVVGDAGRFRLGAGQEERRLVRDFLAYCRAGHA